MRTVRLEPSAEQGYNQCVEQHPRFEEIYRGMEWLLANDPGAQGLGLDLDGFRLCLHGSAWSDLPAIAAVYTFTDELVVIHGLHAVNAIRNQPA